MPQIWYLQGTKYITKNLTWFKFLKIYFQSSFQEYSTNMYFHKQDRSTWSVMYLIHHVLTCSENTHTFRFRFYLIHHVLDPSRPHLFWTHTHIHTHSDSTWSIMSSLVLDTHTHIQIQSLPKLYRRNTCLVCLSFYAVSRFWCWMPRCIIFLLGVTNGNILSFHFSLWQNHFEEKEWIPIQNWFRCQDWQHYTHTHTHTHTPLRGNGKDYYLLNEASKGAWLALSASPKMTWESKERTLTWGFYFD